jgi:hypothetical protein
MPSSAYSLDQAVQERVWSLSLAQVGWPASTTA